jgi:hypothetical protein
MLNFQIEQLKRLPQRSNEAWQGGFVRMPTWIVGKDDRPYRPVACLWISVDAEYVSSPRMCHPDEVDYRMALDGLNDFALDPQFGGYRPGRIEVCDSALASFLSEGLAAADIQVDYRDTLPVLDRLVAEMTEHMVGHEVPPGALLTIRHILAADHRG